MRADRDRDERAAVVTPNGKIAGALLLTPATPQLSPVVGEPSATPVAVQFTVLAASVTFGGQVIVGGVVSNTVMICTFVEALPLASTAR